MSYKEVYNRYYDLLEKNIFNYLLMFMWQE